MPDASRWWTYHSVVRSVQLADGGEYVKSLAGWRGASDAEIRDHAEEIREGGGDAMPSGYNSAFRAAYRAPKVSHSYARQMIGAFRGGWQEALKPGVHEGKWTLYDLRTAYYWALTEGLPDPSFYHRTHSLIYRDALYRVRLAEPEPLAPYPYNQETDVLATGEEIATYGLQVEEVIDGVAFRRGAKMKPILSAIERWSFWRRVARAYWGAWASTGRVECHTPGRSWNLPPLGVNVVWAHLIVGRVRRRLWDVAEGAAHVFVDSVLTQREITTGDNPGDWRVAKEYPAGIRVEAAGHYGPAVGPLDKMAGVPLTDSRRIAIVEGAD